MKNVFRIIMALVAHFDLELLQMIVKIAFLNGSIEEEICMVQTKSFKAKGSQYLICKLNNFIYGLKQASR